MTTTEWILVAGLAVNLLGNIWLLTNHQYSAKADRRELFRRMGRVERNVVRIATKLGIDIEEEGR